MPYPSTQSDIPLEKPFSPMDEAEEEVVEEIRYGREIIAIVLRSAFRNREIAFFTPAEFSQQLAYMSRPKGYRIAPHVHRTVVRKVSRTQEVLWVKKGTVQVDLYRPDRKFLRSIILRSGDTILLASGGHGFQMLDDTEMIEVKQGPYAGDRDKERFTPEAYDTRQ